MQCQVELKWTTVGTVDMLLCRSGAISSYCLW